ncbi:hypothetical protein AKJ45_01100 [candidate division MSBL1 archaeon SCGC-AAA261F19]|uniref:TraD/TraG TraM recognition site domain-containing protein n=2 Tax=candidate division MSBL1 TaxID=215777 RepID=A0A133VB11_9EURY|nr:hypothetical protein AKJ43_01290 [candidate division MSBL1 archaeon SCGC-AAA261D19]KXB03633.1 hypothetical protein AKJ45_01100 [candidate division MSBL1 archaeon SCGC-AAA261F19]
MRGQTLFIFGAALVTKLWFHIASRARGERVPLMLIMDGFQNFAGLETLGVMLAEERKYKIQLVLAHQHLSQLKEREVAPEDVLSNTMTKVAFRTLGKESKILAKNLEPSREKELMSDLTSLPDGQAIVKLRARFAEEPAKPFKVSTLPPPEKEFFDLEKLINRAKERYSLREEEKPETEKEEKELEPGLEKLLKAVQRLGNEGKRRRRQRS